MWILYLIDEAKIVSSIHPSHRTGTGYNLLLLIASILHGICMSPMRIRHIINLHTSKYIFHRTENINAGSRIRVFMKLFLK